MRLCARFLPKGHDFYKKEKKKKALPKKNKKNKKNSASWQKGVISTGRGKDGLNKVFKVRSCNILRKTERTSSDRLAHIDTDTDTQTNTQTTATQTHTYRHIHNVRRTRTHNRQTRGHHIAWSHQQCR